MQHNFLSFSYKNFIITLWLGKLFLFRESFYKKLWVCFLIFKTKNVFNRKTQLSMKHSIDAKNVFKKALFLDSFQYRKA